jgi:signal transduction histidine kinase
MPAGVAGSLSRQQIARIESGRVIETGVSSYRVFAPIVRRQKVVGAVEIDDHIDNLPALLKRSAFAAAWLALVAIRLIALATYVLFRDLIYRPIENLLEVITQAKTGKLDVQAPERKLDELGRLSQEFNGMLGQIHEMTAERERRQEVLRERVHEATAQLEQRNLQLEAANQELWRTTRRLTQLERLAAAGQTAAQFAHEVGTPLGLISCQAQLIQSEAQADPASVNERAEIIVEQSERIERIVRRTLDRTRGEIAEHSPLDLNALIKRITEATLPTLAERGVPLDLSLDRQTPVIAGDADRLQQAFLNLINNALDAMPEGGRMTITTEIQAPANDQRSHVVVSIADTGCGMTAEARARIFDPLYTTKDRGKGTGLGLAVVNQVMQEHGGAIEVESAPGRGSRFRLLFPALSSAHMAAPDDQLSRTTAV